MCRFLDSVCIRCGDCTYSVLKLPLFPECSPSSRPPRPPCFGMSKHAGITPASPSMAGRSQHSSGSGSPPASHGSGRQLPSFPTPHPCFACGAGSCTGPPCIPGFPPPLLAPFYPRHACHVLHGAGHSRGGVAIRTEPKQPQLRCPFAKALPLRLPHCSMAGVPDFCACAPNSQVSSPSHAPASVPQRPSGVQQEESSGGHLVLSRLRCLIPLGHLMHPAPGGIAHCHSVAL